MAGPRIRDRWWRAGPGASSANLNALAAEGHPVDPDDLATITPYITRTIRRFGDWVLNLTPPEGEPVTRLDLEPRALFPTGTV
ncbi:hypothetical protein [Nocardia sp. NPDC057440]|uniref:hypothetical protein n=1 Tax=Nocardia sp. NPDC057440 TaxID=3346134 RepID=UPI00366FE9F3